MMRDKNGDILISGDYVRILALYGTSDLAKVLEEAIDEFSQPMCTVQLLKKDDQDPFRKYPENIQKVSEIEAMLYILEQP
jgi:hypothetical protein